MRECPRCERCYEDEVALCPDDDSKTKNTLPGTTVLNGRYRLEKRLGRGAMGQVYVARDENLLTRRVAVKTIRPDVLSDEDLQEGEAIARFEREARTAASVQHPNVIGVTDFGKSEEGVFFLVMEYVEGESLYQLLRREGTIPVQRALLLLRQTCAGVEAAHDEGILHRDLKPANIFIVQKKKKDGSKLAGDDIVKVGDFGLAKIISQSLAGITSGAGPASRGILGTPEYMAPEQMHAGAVLDARADVYALGAIAYHMLGGRPPFTGEIMQIFAQKLTQETPELNTLRSDIPRPVEKAVMHALAKEAEARPATVAEWFHEFDEAVGSASIQEEEEGETRVVVMAPMGAEVYVDDERHGSIGRSGRLILSSIPPGQHVLRIAHAGDKDDERVIEIRSDAEEQIIQAQFKSGATSGLSPSKGGSLGSVSGVEIKAPAIVSCSKCGSRFAAGAKFCGRCGNTSFEAVTAESLGAAAAPRRIAPSPSLNQAILRGSNIRCTRCGVDQPAGTKFCGRCGTTLATVRSDRQAPTLASENKSVPSLADTVRCSVFTPAQAKPGDQFLAQVFAHLADLDARVREIATEFDSKAKRRGAQVLNKPVERNSELTVQLFMPGFVIHENIQRLIWRGSAEPESVQFKVQIPADHQLGDVIGTVMVSAQSVPIGHIKFRVTVKSSDSQKSANGGRNESERWVSYKKAFISYASADRAEVLKRVQMLRFSGTTFFQDVLNLEPGERWQRSLYREIDSSDVFYLFWSTAAKNSEWVMKEVDYALQRKVHDDDALPEIIPVIIEGPPPVPPPPSLSHLNFNDHLIYFIVRNAAQEEWSQIVCTRCGVDQPAGTKFCGRCGASLGGAQIAWSPPRPVEVLCRGCGVTYPSGTKFCGRCGRTL